MIKQSLSRVVVSRFVICWEDFITSSFYTVCKCSTGLQPPLQTKLRIVVLYDMADELLDLVDEEDNVIGTVWKSEAHGNPGMIHREIAVGVFNDLGEVLIQQRSMNKTSPGSWEISAAGHIGAGENPDIAVKREVKEELGLDIEPIYYSKEFDYDAYHQESKFYWVYYAIVTGRPKIIIDETEVMDAKWIDPAKLIDFAIDNDWNINGGSHKMIMKLKEKIKA